MLTFNKAEIDFEATNWGAAREEFQKNHKDKKKMEQFLRSQVSIDEAKASCVEAQTKAEQKYSKALGGILSKMETFLRVGDLAVKSAPESVGLAWSGIRLCLHAVEEDFTTFNLYSAASADIIGILISCRVYGKMYGSHEGPADFQELHEKVVGFIPSIYANILEFSYMMMKHMDRKFGDEFLLSRVFRGLFTSALATVGPMIDNIREHEKKMSAFASQASDRLNIHYAKTGLQNQGEMTADLSAIKETLKSSMEVNKIYLIQLRQYEEERKNLKKKTPFDKAKDQFDANEKRLNPTPLPQQSLSKNLKRKEEGTCQWIFGLESYRAWRNSSHSDFLWVSGVGGLGKSILMSAVIDNLQEESKEHAKSRHDGGSGHGVERKDDEQFSVQYFFCSGGEGASRVGAKIKAQILLQLYELAVSASTELLVAANEVAARFLGKSSADQETRVNSEKASTFDEAYLALARVLHRKTFIVVDAVDECKDRSQSNLLKNLQDTLLASDVQVKIIVCSRPETDIVDDLIGRAIIKVEDHNGPDIEKAAKSRLEGLAGLSGPERVEACNAIVTKAKGLFRCVDPAIEFLENPWQRPLASRLRELPDGLDNSYQQILRQTDPDYLGLLRVALTWCIIARVKPTGAEIMDDHSCAYAEGVEGGDGNPYDADGDQGICDQIRKAGSGTFLEVTDDNIVSVRHTTVKEFFLKPEQPVDKDADLCDNDASCPKCRSKATMHNHFTLSEKEGHLRMAITIFRHLNSPLFQRRYLFKEKSEHQQAESTSVTDNKSNAMSSINNETEEQSLTNNGAFVIDQKEHVIGVQKIERADDFRRFDDVPETTDSDQKAKEEEIGGKLSKTPVVKSTEEEGGEPDEDGLVSDEPTPGPNSAKTDFLAGDDDEQSELGFYAASEAAETDSDEPIIRYELTDWHYHLREAERLVKFLCETPEAFKAWQDLHMQPLELCYLDQTSLGALHIAAVYGLTGLAEVLIKRGMSVTEETGDGRQPLWFAAGHDVCLLKLLLENGAEPNSRKHFQPPFHRLLWLKPEVDGVQLMLDHGADYSIMESWKLNAMHWFSIFGSEVGTLLALLDNGGNMNISDGYGETPLHKLVRHAELPLELLRVFLEKGAVINIDDEESQRPLYEVCSVGNVEAAKLLLDNGADVLDDDKYGMTALHIAAYRGHLETVRLLTRRVASISQVDNCGRTPFYYASLKGHYDTAHFLLSTLCELGDTSFNTPMEDGRTPLSKAAAKGHLEIVTMLLGELDTGKVVNARETKVERTALHRAAYNGRGDVVDLLLKEGADATIQDAGGKTALALCSQGWVKAKSDDWERLITRLIDATPDTAANESDLMATAAIKGSTQIIEKLLDAKAHPNKQDEHGWTPLQLARQYGHTEAANVLSRHGAEVGSRPSRWVSEKDEIRISEDGTELKFVGDFNRTMVLANHPIPAGVERFYFEVDIQKNDGENPENPFPCFGIGFATQPARLDQMPGWHNPVAPSWAYHGDDGCLFANSNTTWKPYTPPYGPGDTVGCGVIYQDGVNGTIFYTRNGKPLGVAFEKDVKGRLYPTIAVAEQGTSRGNFGNDLQGRPFAWPQGNVGGYSLAAIERS
ncbi:MAG: hypothetical protein M1833_005914 [Piccolia ochrophora]|nr:MAG: hypothetical protein M1833_005914 [Piccolia ochrophora]